MRRQESTRMRPLDEWNLEEEPGLRALPLASGPQIQISQRLQFGEPDYTALVGIYKPWQ